MHICCLHVYVYMCVHTHMCIHTHTYAYICVHTSFVIRSCPIFVLKIETGEHGDDSGDPEKPRETHMHLTTCVHFTACIKVHFTTGDPKKRKYTLYYLSEGTDAWLFACPYDKLRDVSKET